MDTGYLYDINISDIELNSLYKVVNNNKLKVIEAGNTPYGICVDGYNNTWNTNFGSDSVSKIDANNEKINIKLSPGSKPYGICVNNDMHILVSNSGRNSISTIFNNIKIDMDIEVGDTPKGIAVDGKNVIWVANFMSGAVARIENRKVTYIQVGANPYGVCVDKDGVVYVTNFGAGTVSRIVNGIKDLEDIQVGVGPKGICMDMDNNIWVTNSGDGSISKIVNGVNVKTIAINGTPCSIAIDINNNIIVIDSEFGNIYKINKDLVIDTLSIGGTPISFGDFTGMQCYILFDNIEFSQIKKVSYKDLDKPLQNMLQNSSGEVTEPSDASSISYHNASYPTIEAALDKLLYVVPIITNFTNDINTVELGTIVNNITLNWSLNKDVITQSIDQNIGALNASLRTKNLTNLNLTSNKTWSLTINDGTTTVNKSTSVNFSNKRYWGVSASISLTDADIIAMNSEFSNTRVQTKTLNALGGKYLYIILPTSFNCDISKFKIGGLYNSSWALTRRAFINSNGYSSSYDIYRLDNLQNGSNIVVEVV